MPQIASAEYSRWLLAAAVPLALLIDFRLGEPPTRFHPVVWMGRYLGRAGCWLAPAQPPGGADWTRFWLGAGLWLFAGAVVVAIAALLQQWALGLHPLAGLLLVGAALKPLLAWRMLRDEVLAVETALGASLDEGRGRLVRLVSRDVQQLSETGIRESAIETLAENLNDSLVAPLFWFAVLGLPGAALYRFANTADAMWGYPAVYAGRDWAWAGKWAARADDVLSWVPARITALLLIAMGWRRGRPVLAGLRREARRTPSPNSGWPMAAMALLLDVRLGKPGVYVLNAAGQTPRPPDIARAISLAQKAVMACVACTVAVILSIGTVTEVWR
jgi:adenosylcobinamide-phosphate synthase